MRTSFSPGRSGHRALSRRRLVLCQTAIFPSVQISINSKTRPRTCSARSAKATRPAIEEFNKYSPKLLAPGEVKLADAQLALARSYQAPSWTRLVQACKLVDAIWEDDIETVRNLVTKNPHLIHESALIRKSNWGAPMSYAANLGRDEIIEMLHKMGATDHMHALDRAALQSKVSTAKLLHKMLGSPIPPPDSLGGPAYTLSVPGTQLMLEMGVKAVGENGERLAPVDVVLETDSRNPEAKHRILELYAEHGVELPDTPVMALHRGRIDLLEKHLRLDPALLGRTFTHEEIYPPEFGCHDEVLATQGHAAKRHDTTSYVRRLRRDGDRPMAVTARRGCQCTGGGG